ncbi:MAG: Toxin RTX-I translocation ATP-binding protein [Syntrophorhabdus sp. PtaB.Bin184]|nr:MAG: Toxin RTX-I translocation ATP-binding protein [Syntrophorhabdus sp. PtaB.Bin184]
MLEDRQGMISVLRKLWQLLEGPIRTQRKPLCIASVFIILSTFGSLLGPFLIKMMVDTAIPARDTSLLMSLSGALILIFIIAYLLWIAHVYYSIKASEKIFSEFRQRLFEGILDKERAFFDRFQSGDIVTRITGDLESISAFFNQTVLRSIAVALFALLLVIGLLIWNWKLGSIFIVSLPFLYLYARWNYRSIAEKYRLSREKLTVQNDLVVDAVGGIMEVRFFQQTGAMARRFSKASGDYAEANINNLTISNLTSQGLELLGLIVRVLPFIIGGFMICQGSSDITTGMLIAYFMIFFRLSVQVFLVFQSMVAAAQVLPSINRIEEMLAFPEVNKEEEIELEDVPRIAGIEFLDVSFAYAPGRKVLDRFHLTIGPGEKIAVMGPSGSGKSTLAQLLLRFLRPEEGTILFGDRDVASYPLPFYLSYFAYVRQETHLFRQTIRENIAMGWYGVPLEDIHRVASLVRMDKVIEELPHGYETVFGRDGLNFSGGQKQRIALARALVRDPAILVLDEFTSGLDRQVEEEILDDLFRVFRDQTIICITHKRSVADRFDRVVHLYGHSNKS